MSTKDEYKINGENNFYSILLSNYNIYLSLMKYCDRISRIWQTISINSSTIKRYLVAQISAYFLAIVLFADIHYMVKTP